MTPLAGARAVLAGLLALPLAATACSSSAPPLCVAAADVTLSTDDPAVRERYLDAIDTLAAHCAEHRGRFFADVLTDHSLASPITPVSVDFDSERLRDNSVYDAPVIAGLVEEANRQAETMLDRAPQDAPSSDLLGGLVSIAGVFATADQSAGRILVMASDGLQNTPPVDVTTAPLDEQGIQRLLADADAAGLVASLDGVRVHMVGVGVGEVAQRLEPERLVGVTRFWAAYFEAAGAELVSANEVLVGLP